MRQEVKYRRMNKTGYGYKKKKNKAAPMTNVLRRSAEGVVTIVSLDMSLWFAIALQASSRSCIGDAQAARHRHGIVGFYSFVLVVSSSPESTCPATSSSRLSELW